MTRKTALLQAISILSKNKKYKEIAEKLQEIEEEYPNTFWSKKRTFDAIEQFKIDHNGRIPNVIDFRNKELPSATSIKYLFNQNVTDFLNQYYPERKSISTKRFKNKSVYYWLNDFNNTYYKINNGFYVTMQIYDLKRTPGSPTAKTLIKLFNLDSYSELVNMIIPKKEYSIEIKI